MDLPRLRWFFLWLMATSPLDVFKLVGAKDIAKSPLDVFKLVGAVCTKSKGSKDARKHSATKRLHKEAKSKQGDVSAFVKDQIKNLDTKYVVRENERVPLNFKTKKHAKVIGRGLARRWTPQALLRSCFGTDFMFRSFASRTRASTRSRARRQRPNPLASSGRAAACFMFASHTHLQKVRNAVAHIVLEKQQAYITDKPPGERYRILKLALDETDVIRR